MKDDLTKYKYLIDTMDIGMVHLDTDGKVIEVNSAASQILGLTKKKLSGLHFPSKEYRILDANGNTLPWEKQPTYITLHTGKKVRDVVIGVPNLRTNVYSWLEINTIAEFDDDKKIVGVICVFCDLSPLKKKEEQLLKFKNAIDFSSEAIVLATPDGTLLYRNKAFESLSDKVSLKYADDLFVDKKIVNEILRTGKEGRDWNGDADIYGRDGEIRNIRLKTHTIREENKAVSAIVIVHTDVTSQKKIEKERLENEEKFRIAFENAPTGMSIIGPGGKSYLAVNPLLCKMFGYTKEEFLGNSISLVTHPDDEKKSYEWIRKKMNDEPCEEDFEKRFIHKDGHVLWGSVRAQWLKNDDGSMKMAITHITDITERKAIEEELRESQLRYKALIETQTDLVSRYLPDTTLTYVNNAYCMFFGKRREELLGQSFLFMIAPEYRDIVCKETLQLSTERGSVTGEYLNYRFDGRCCCIQWAVKCITDKYNNVVELQAVGRDITDIKNAETALRESEKKYRRLVDNMQDAIFMLDTEGIITFTNASAARLLGCESAEMMTGMKASDFYYDPKTIGKQYELLKQQGVIKNLEVTLKRKETEEPVHVLANVRINQDKHGIITGIEGVYHDITDRKKYEEKLLESEQKYRDIFNASGDAIFIHEMPGGKIIDVNEAMLNMFGFQSKEEALEKAFRAFTSVGSFNTKAALRKLKQTEKYGPQTFEWVVKHEITGEMIWTEVSLTKSFISGHKRIIASARDISERKRAEQKIRESEEKFRHVAEKSPSMIYIVQDDKVVYINNAGEKYLKGNAETLIGSCLNIKDAVNENYLETARKNYQKLRNGIDIPTVEFTLKDFEGNTLEVINNSKVIEYNNSPAILGIITDSSESKKLEKALAESERKFRSMIEHSREAITLINAKGEVMYESPSVSSIAGYSIEERLGKNSLDTVHPEDRERVGLLLHKVISEKGGYVHTRFRGIKKDGTVWWIEGSAVNRLHDPDIPSIIINYRDITAQKEAEDRLKLTQFGIDHSQIAIFQLNDEGRVYFANEQACTSLGYSKDEICNLSVTDFCPDYDTNRWEKHRKDPYRKEDLAVETCHRRKDGSTFPVEITINLVEFEGKKVSFSFAKDITERKKTEEALQNQFIEYMKLNRQYEEKNHELGQTLNKLQRINNELVTAKQKAEESDRLKTAFLANMSHEIRTPMNGILGFTELLKTSDLSGNEQSKYLGIIQQSGERMLNIINDLVDISKIEAGQAEVTIAPASITRMLDMLYEFFLLESEKKNLKLIVSKQIIRNRDIIDTDEVKLQQILSNLIKNALKYTSSGEIEFGCKTEKNQMIFFVRDTGIGIRKEFHTRIFERFVQAEPKPGAAVEGSGLGLSISKAYIEMLGGTIRVESEPGVGSTFIISFPCKPKRSVKDKKPVPEAGRIDAPAMTILIAEDDDTSYFYLEELLKKQKFKLLRAIDGRQAIDLIDKEPEVNMVLMDVKMPVMNGYEATRIIKEKRPALPVIVQTAYALSNDNKRAFEAGCDDYIVKPINREVLLEVIKKHLNPGRP